MSGHLADVVQVNWPNLAKIEKLGQFFYQLYQLIACFE